MYSVIHPETTRVLSTTRSCFDSTLEITPGIVLKQCAAANVFRKIFVKKKFRRILILFKTITTGCRFSDFNNSRSLFCTYECSGINCNNHKNDRLTDHQCLVCKTSNEMSDCYRGIENEHNVQSCPMSTTCIGKISYAKTGNVVQSLKYFGVC